MVLAMLGLEDILKRIAKTVEPFDQRDLLAKIAGLQLVSENAGRATRLQAIAHVAASKKPESDKPAIGIRELKGLCNDRDLIESQVGLCEDPCDNVFTEAFTFHGGSFIVFPGITDEVTFILRNLAKALFLAQQKIPNNTFLTESHGAFLAILSVSNAIASKAGLGRGMEPIEDFKQAVSVPKSSNLHRLAEAVLFNKSELRFLLDKWQLDWSSIDPFVLDAGSFSFKDYRLEEGPLHQRPLVRYGDYFVIAEPGLLLAALRHRIISLAIIHGVIDEVASKFRAAVWDSVLMNIGYLSLNQVGFPPAQNAPFHDGLFTLDTDKALYIQLATDELKNYSIDSIYGTWQNPGIMKVLEQRQLEVEEQLFTAHPSFANHPAINEVLVLILFEGVGRLAAFGIGEPLAPFRSHRLSLTAADLETICLLEMGEPLILLKYSTAQERIRERTKVISIGQLDEFNLYRDCDYSYYISDERKPDTVYIGPGGAGELRRQVHRRRDRHAVLSYNVGYVTEVTCLYGPEVPIYTPFSEIGQQVSILIEDLPIPIWVVGPLYKNEIEKRLHSHLLQFADMVAYWLWQMTPSLSKYFEGLSATPSPLVIRLEIPPDEAWFSPISTEEGPLPPDKAVPSIAVLDGEFSIQLIVGHNCMKGMMSIDNAGERAFMREVLRAFQLVLNRHGALRGHEMDENAIEEIIERHAPLGIKKKLLALNTAVEPRIDPTGLPDFREVQHADEQVLLDEIGAHLLSKGYSVGDIPNSKRVEVLNDHVVEYLYSRLKSVVATLNSKWLLYCLVAYHETIIHDLVFTRLTIPTQLACFGDQPRLIAELREQLSEIYITAVANRFLIEYVTARPPSGFRPMSIAIYDQLMVFASEIVNYGFASDMLHHEITDEKISILPSERLGMNQERFIKARSAFLSEHAEREVKRATQAFHRFWSHSAMANGNHVTSDSEPGDVIQSEIDAAFKVEFGFTLIDFAIFVGDVFRMGTEQASVVKTCEFQQFVDALSKSLSWDRTKVEAMIDLMGLRPRTDFLVPPEPFRDNDVYPWIFNRRLSYIRRPLLIEKAEDKTIVRWGNRHLYQSLENLVHLCTSGRLKGESPQMQQLMSRFQNEIGDAFNKEVARIFEHYPQLKVRLKVKEIQGRKLIGPEGDLGDIDVLVVFPHKRKVVLVETKDLALARTPREVSNELNELFRGTKRKKSTVVKQQNREKWVSTNLEKVLADFGLSPDDSWEVESIIVLDDESFSKHLFPSPIPVVTLPRLETDFLSRWLQNQ